MFPHPDTTHAQLTRWRLWQLVDSALPTGGFAHSSGLEAAHRLGFVRDAAGLDAFLDELLWQTGHFALPLLGAAHADAARFDEIDQLADALTQNHVARRASRAQGRALLDACTRIFADVAALVAVQTAARARHAPCHLAPVAGVSLGALGVPRGEAQALLLHWTLRGAGSAAVRLGLVGPFEAQALHARHAARCEGVLTACGALGLDALAQTAPLLDLASACHDRQYSRLFQS